jgi:hypothetical protein
MRLRSALGLCSATTSQLQTHGLSISAQKDLLEQILAVAEQLKRAGKFGKLRHVDII